MAKIAQGIGKKLNPSEARASISLHKIAPPKKPVLISVACVTGTQTALVVAIPAVHVILGCPWDLVVYDMLDVLDVQPAGGHVGGYQNPARVFREPVQIFQPLPLLHLRVQPQGAALEVPEQVDQPSHRVDGVGEDNRPTRVLGQHVVQVEVLLQ